jgi:phage FluMu protein Com
MSEYQIVKCRLCGKLMKRYPFQVYQGDESCCEECNAEVNEKDNIKFADIPLQEN